VEVFRISECIDSLSLPPQNIGRKTKRSRPSNLKELLLLAVKRMMFPGTEIFQAAVPDDIMTHYREYIFFPMHLGRIKEKVMARQYGSTREFLHDTEWILHNCIIYNGGIFYHAVFPIRAHLPTLRTAQFCHFYTVLSN